MKREVSPWAIRGLYLVAFTLAITPAVEIMAMLWPYRPGDVVWRYGALGIAAGQLPNVAVGMTAILAMAYWRAHTRTFRTASYACLLIALLVIPAMGIFALDVNEVRALRPEEARGSVLASALIQQVRYLVSGAALACMGVAGVMTEMTSPIRVPSPGVLRAGER